MRVPYGWLRELLPELPGAAETADLLVGIGLGVEEVHELPAPVDGIVVAEIRRAEPIPGSDHLRATVVWDGERERSVVCGAPNARAGLRTALALPGTELPAAGFTVAVRQMLGVESAGVLCSPREAGLYDHAGGIVELGADAEPGTPLAELWPAETVLELEITPNRADAFSVLGVARDLAAKLSAALRHPAAGLEPGAPTDAGYTVEIADRERCPRMTLRRIENVTVAPAPVWLQQRLAAVGLRPRNNVVDVTNYVTYELGQPSHAYDARVLTDDTLQVRRAREGEALVALGEIPLVLTGEDLVIATPDGQGGSRAVGLAGVIGGMDDSVRPDTATVALEVAHFEPVGIRRTAKRHGLSTDAHYRFERGVDPNLPPLASIRAAQLIAEVSGGRAAADYAQVGGDIVRPAGHFRPERVEFLMGFDVAPAEQRRMLEALGCEVEEERSHGEGGAAWRVTPPSWRFDLAIEEDYVEEVGRLHGYDAIVDSRPAMDFVPPDTDPTHRTLREQLAAMGHQEILSYVFTGAEELARAAAPAPAVRLAHPQGEERSVLRTRLWPGLLQAARLNRSAPSLALFEVGRVFLGDRVDVDEHEHLGIVWRGPWADAGWRPAQPLDLFVAKGLLEALAARLGATFELRPVAAERAPHLHPGVAGEALWNGRPVGTMGRVHPEVAARFDLAEVYLAELELPLEPGRVRFRDVPRQPYAERDLAVIAPADVPFGSLAELARDAAGERLETLEPFDVYRGDPIPEGQRSVALRMRFRHPERSLTDAEVDGFMENVIAAMRGGGYAIRE